MTQPFNPPLTAIALNATLKRGDDKHPSSTERILRYLETHLAPYDVTTEHIRLSEFNIEPGVTSLESDRDDWPRIREKIINADILIFGSPIWLGQPSSICKRVLERMDAFLSETDDHNRMPSYGRIAVVAVVGNEDGAHLVSSQLYQALNDVGFTIPANGVTYWVGEAMQSTNFVDLAEVPETVASATKMLAANCAHLARLLKNAPYPGSG
ncbi:NADPH-dependent oxidoreductase [Falsochrobactrum shanghaiense]|uniref:NADPH-dependent oxidoreductase n=1 Tax=Falsochrobactrum shanghaiense TaxID=2201899 RepID=A0A316J5F4_9HYPH|nr:flavodoxin family protein [Falsochrobactrum shanghaiense]PWL16551.1 NADPH-dependent oxidoreductase [Falsochrobactrum shanghaiense]